MLDSVYVLLSTAITLAAGVGGYLIARSFVRRRLRFVDAVRSPFAPLVAGVAAFGVGLVAAILPLITLTTAVVLGIGTALGTASGVRALDRGDWNHRQLNP
jgi:hypothetical protein